MTGLQWCLWGRHHCCCRAAGGLQRAPWRSSWGCSPGLRRQVRDRRLCRRALVSAWDGAASLILDPGAKCSEAMGCFQQLSLRTSVEEGSPWFPFSQRGYSCLALFSPLCWSFDKTRGGAKVDLQFRVRDIELILVLLLFINCCIIFHTNNCTPTFVLCLTPVFIIWPFCKNCVVRKPEVVQKLGIQMRTWLGSNSPSRFEIFSKQKPDHIVLLKCGRD